MHAIAVLLFFLPTSANIKSHPIVCTAIKDTSIKDADTTKKKNAVAHPNGPGSLGPDNSSNQSDNDNGNGSSPQSTLSPLLSYNFSSGNNNLSSLTPVINYGWTKDWGRFLGGKFSIAFNPYSAGQISIKDSSSYLPALMLPGVAGINLNMFLTYGQNDLQLIWFPINFGLKLNTSFGDSSQTIIEHNIRTAIGLRYNNLFQMGLQYTWGWHNLTSESEQVFKQVFKSSNTRISYIVATIEFYLNNNQNSTNSSNVLSIQWRCITDKGAFTGLPNAQILTIGFKKDLDLTHLVPAGGHPKIQ